MSKVIKDLDELDEYLDEELDIEVDDFPDSPVEVKEEEKTIESFCQISVPVFEGDKKIGERGVDLKTATQEEMEDWLLHFCPSLGRKGARAVVEKMSSTFSKRQEMVNAAVEYHKRLTFSIVPKDKFGDLY